MKNLPVKGLKSFQKSFITIVMIREQKIYEIMFQCNQEIEKSEDIERMVMCNVWGAICGISTSSSTGTLRGPIRLPLGVGTILT
jgi:hypothetical protein